MANLRVDWREVIPGMFCLLGVLLAGCSSPKAAGPDRPGALKVVRLSGEARYSIDGTDPAQAMRAGMTFNPGAAIETAAGDGYLEMTAGKSMVVRLYPDSSLVINGMAEQSVGKAAGQQLDLQLRRGSIFVQTGSRKPSRNTCTVSSTNGVVRVLSGGVRLFDNGHLSTAKDPALIVIPGKVGAITVPARCVVDPVSGEYGYY